jgi:hypothetical protein
MINKLILLISALTLIVSACTTPSRFKSDVDTTKKPWTNLSFNNDPNNFQFGIMSDKNGGSRPGVFEDGVKKLNIMLPEFVMCVGDLIPGYTTDTAVIKKDWNDVNTIISGLKMPFFYLPGNHDITNKTMEKEWEKLYGRRYYNFVYKNALFIILDSNDDDDYNLTTKQTDFVLNTLQKNGGVRWTFIFMHHPIWKYNTDGRFEKIEKALKNRKYTVIAGHEHHYHQAERNGSNYYILSTTGAGSALRGNYFGEFDHISWVTVTDNGPVIANLRLDGILPHDISNDKTDLLAKPLLENSNFNHLILCNKGDKFTNGTLYLSFKNPADTDLEIKLNFFHNHQLQIEKPELVIHLAAGENQVVEVPVTAIKPLDYGSIDLLCFDWEMKYNHPGYPGFGLHGKYQITVEPGKPEFIDRDISIFVGKASIGFVHPYPVLESVFRINNSEPEKYSRPIEINETSKLSFFMKNSKEEYTNIETRNFEKSEFNASVEIANPQPGLNYKYYEGNWSSMPDFAKLKPEMDGIANNFSVRDYALREDYWGLSFTGFIKIEEDNFYQLMIKADDTGRFYVNNKVVVDENTLIKGANVGAVALKKGFHPIRIEFLEKIGNQRLRVYIKKSGAEEWIQMEAGHFFHN